MHLRIKYKGTVGPRLGPVEATKYESQILGYVRTGAPSWSRLETPVTGLQDGIKWITLTIKVFLFITNIPEDLDGIDEGYLEKEINELNQKAFVIVIFVHPMADDELRTIPYR